MDTFLITEKYETPAVTIIEIVGSAVFATSTESISEGPEGKWV